MRYLLIWRSLKVKSLLLRVDGFGERSVADLAFYNLNTILAEGERIWANQSLKVQISGESILKLRTDRRIIREKGTQRRFNRVPGWG